MTENKILNDECTINLEIYECVLNGTYTRQHVKVNSSITLFTNRSEYETIPSNQWLQIPRAHGTLLC